MKKKAVDTKKKALIDGLADSWRVVRNDLRMVKHEIEQLEYRKQLLLTQLDGMLKTFDVLGERPADLEIPPELRFKPKITIGDAMEKVLLERGPLPKKELIEILTQGQVIKNPKNSRILIANAVSKDGRKRFRITQDGKVELAKENKNGQSQNP
jgi:hypothetical protein